MQRGCWMIGWIVFTIGSLFLTGEELPLPPLPAPLPWPPAKVPPVARRVAAVSVAATARADSMFMRVVMVVTETVREDADRTVMAATLPQLLQRDVA
jgi:hypothetical protein